MEDNQLLEFLAVYNSDCIRISLSVATWIVLVAFIVFITFFIIKYRHFFRYNSIKLKKIELNLPGGKVGFEVERNHSNLEIAHKIYIELITRKAAIPVDENKDVISEVYDSWYELFFTTRDEIKRLNGELLKQPKSEALVEMATDVLNKGLRPHLTEYQARFRRWYELALIDDKNKGFSPQEVQENFPDYDELIASMKKVNEILIQYANELKKFIYSK